MHKAGRGKAICKVASVLTTPRRFHDANRKAMMRKAMLMCCWTRRNRVVCQMEFACEDTHSTLHKVKFLPLLVLDTLWNYRQENGKAETSTPITPLAPTTTTTTTTRGQQQQMENEKEELPKGTKDPLRWVWLDGASLSLQWPARFSLSINGAVTAYSLSLTHPLEARPFADTTLFHADNLRHQFEGLRSNVSYDGQLVALVGQHHWPYTLLNFTVTSPSLHTGLGLGQRANPVRPTSTTADLEAITVSVRLRWSPTPFLKGQSASEVVRPVAYRLRVWDQKQLMAQVVTDASSHTQGCEAAVGGLALDTVYKATLEAVQPDGEPGTSLSFSLDAGALHVAGGGLTTDGVSECYSGLQVRCPGSERCVSPYWICDGAPDCPDGADEVGCDTTPCDGYRCWDDVCIPWAWRCDGHLDCKEGDDEYACPACDDGQVQCPWGGVCLQQNATCDGVADCRDGWDESAVLCGSMTCGAGELQCLGGDRCVSHQWLCDGVADCPAAEDEDITFCSAFTSFRDSTVFANATNESTTCGNREPHRTIVCTEEEFQCDSQRCIMRKYMCDGVEDCRDGRDELPQFCSPTPATETTTRRFRFDSEEDLSDAEKGVTSGEEETECSGRDGEHCGNLGTHSQGSEGDKEVATTTDSSHTHSREASTTEKPEQVLDPNKVIDEELPDLRSTATTNTTTTTTAATTTTTTTTSTASEESRVSIIEANMTDMGVNEIDVQIFENTDLAIDEEIEDKGNKTLHDVTVSVEVFLEGEEEEEEVRGGEEVNEENPALSHPDTSLNLSSSEEYDDENLALDIDRLKPVGSKNTTDRAKVSGEGTRQGFSDTTLQEPDVMAEENEGEPSEENVDREIGSVTPTTPTHKQNSTPEEEQKDVSAEDDVDDQDDDNVALSVSESSVIVQSKNTSTTEATVNVTQPFVPSPSTTSDVIHNTSSTLRIPTIDVTLTTSPISDLTTPSRKVKEEMEEDTILHPGVTNISLENSTGKPQHPDRTSLELVTTTTTFTTTTTTTTTTTSTMDPKASPAPTEHAEETATTKTTTEPATTSLSTSTLSPTETPTREAGLKNRTILIAIRAGANESEVPQYTIHGADGSTYQYEIVSIVREEEEEEEDNMRNSLEVEEEMTNEIRGDGSHQFLQGVHISSAPRLVTHGSCLILFLSFFSTNVFWILK